MTTYLPGAALLKQWLADHDVSARRFGIDNRIAGDELSKIMRGLYKTVSVDFAVKVEDATGGAVPVRSWVPCKVEGGDHPT
jgi:hypothetical protein